MQRLKFFWPYLSNKNPKFNKNEDTPLHFVACNGLSDVFDFMIEEKQSVEDCLYTNGSHGYITPLHYACINGHAEIIRSLRRKIDFELIEPSLFGNILQKGIGYGSLDCIKALLEKQTSYFIRNHVWITRKYYSNTKNENHYKIEQYLTKEFGLTTWNGKGNPMFVYS